MLMLAFFPTLTSRLCSIMYPESFIVLLFIVRSMIRVTVSPCVLRALTAYACYPGVIIHKSFFTLKSVQRGWQIIILSCVPEHTCMCCEVGVQFDSVPHGYEYTRRCRHSLLLGPLPLLCGAGLVMDQVLGMLGLFLVPWCQPGVCLSLCQPPSVSVAPCNLKRWMVLPFSPLYISMWILESVGEVSPRGQEDLLRFLLWFIQVYRS